MRVRRQNLHVYEFHSGDGAASGCGLLRTQLFGPTGSLLQTRDVPITLLAPQSNQRPELEHQQPRHWRPVRVLYRNASESGKGSLRRGGRRVARPNGRQANARRSTGAVVVQCGSGSGILPTGACTVSNVIIASNSSAGTGTLVPGAATFELDLTANGTVVALDSVLRFRSSIASVAAITEYFAETVTSDTVLLRARVHRIPSRFKIPARASRVSPSEGSSARARRAAPPAERLSPAGPHPACCRTASANSQLSSRRRTNQRGLVSS